MIEIKQCLICDGPIAHGRKGLVAPFLAERIWNRKAFNVRIAKCANCGFAFFNPRMEESEENRLYEGYRSAQYQQMRFRHEPWYTDILNNQLSAETGTLDHRRQIVASALAEYVSGGHIRTVLDFGGDQGQLIQQLDIPDKYVFDISGTRSREGVVPLRSLAECALRSWDLIVCSHVLEHVGFPRGVMSQIKQIARPGTLLYVEVPHESPFAPAVMAKRLAQMLILCGTRLRDAAATLRPSGLYLMHEHVSFFAAKSLANMATSLGFSVVKTGEYRTEGSLLLRGDCVWCIAKLPPGETANT